MTRTNDDSSSGRTDGPDFRVSRREALVGIAGLGVLGPAARSVTASDDHEVAVSVRPAELTVESELEESLDVVVEGADNGISTLMLELSVSDGAVIDVTDVELTKESALTRVDSDGDTVAFEAAMGNNSFEPADEITLARLTVVAKSTGTATVRIEEPKFDDQTPEPYAVSETTGATVTVTENENRNGDGDENGDDEQDGSDEQDGTGDGDDEQDEGDQQEGDTDDQQDEDDEETGQAGDDEGDGSDGEQGDTDSGTDGDSGEDEAADGNSGDGDGTDGNDGAGDDGDDGQSESGSDDSADDSGVQQDGEGATGDAGEDEDGGAGQDQDSDASDGTDDEAESGANGTPTDDTADRDGDDSDTGGEDSSTVEEDDNEIADDGTADDDGPGFGIATGVAGLGALGYGLLRRLSGTEPGEQ